MLTRVQFLPGAVFFASFSAGEISAAVVGAFVEDILVELSAVVFAVFHADFFRKGIEKIFFFSNFLFRMFDLNHSKKIMLQKFIDNFEISPS